MSSVTGQAHGIGAAQASARSAPLYTATTPSAPAAAEVSTRRDAGVGVGAAHDGEVQRAGDVEVGGEAGFAGEQGRVLAAQQALADDGVRTASVTVIAPPASAAASTALTMLW